MRWTRHSAAVVRCCYVETCGKLVEAENTRTLRSAARWQQASACSRMAARRKLAGADDCWQQPVSRRPAALYHWFLAALGKLAGEDSVGAEAR